MPAQIIPLVQVFVEIPDFRHSQGKRYSLSAILALACAAILCGYRSYGAMAEWGRNYGAELTAALGFQHGQTPCAATLHTIFRHLDTEQFEARLGQWAESVLQARPAGQHELEGVAADGKTQRGSAKQGAPGAHLLSAVSQRLGLTLAQQAVNDKSNELGHIQALLAELILPGKVVTTDALHTQRQTAQAIVDHGGDYLMIVKENQPQLRADIETLFQEPQVVAETLTQACTIESGHGRIETRCLTASTALLGYLDWPGHQQVFRLERTVTLKKTGVQRHEVVYGITSLSPHCADAARLLRLDRRHWRIEATHWIRDVTFDEDRSQVRCGHVAEVMAALRNLAIALLRLAGETNIAAACRRLAAQPWAALALIGITRENCMALL
jgi:predicted transposase YbfD/YdcC